MCFCGKWHVPLNLISPLISPICCVKNGALLGLFGTLAYIKKSITVTFHWIWPFDALNFLSLLCFYGVLTAENTLPPSPYPCLNPDIYCSFHMQAQPLCI